MTDRELQDLRNLGHDDAADEIERFRQGYERYETARLMKPSEWSEAWWRNITTGKSFDEIIDDMRPLMRPASKPEGDAG